MDDDKKEKLYSLTGEVIINRQVSSAKATSTWDEERWFAYHLRIRDALLLITDVKLSTQVRKG